MKHKVSLLTGAFLAVAASGVFAQTAVTDPVGYITLPVSGGGAVATPVRSYIGASLVNKVEYAGSLVSAAGTTLTFGAASFTAGAFNDDAANGNLYYIEVTSGSNAGAWTDIVSNTATTITTLDNISSLVSAGTTVKIRKHHTVNTLFGANNTAGFAAGIDISSADELQFLDAATQQATTVFFSTDDLNPGWVTAAGAAAGNKIVAPGDGIKVTRKSSAALPIIQVGHVKTGPTWIPIEKGLNVVSVPLATGTTLDNSALAAAGALSGGIDIGAADEVGRLNNGAFTSYFFSTDDLNPGWVTAAGASAGSTVLAEGTAFRVVRKGNATNWKAPAQTIAQ